MSAATSTIEQLQALLASERFVVPPVRAGVLIMSVQASRGHYYLPRQDDGPWTHVEIGFPTRVIPEFLPYSDGPINRRNRPTKAVYGYVPIETVAAVIDRFGGMKMTSEQAA